MSEFKDVITILSNDMDRRAIKGKNRKAAENRIKVHKATIKKNKRAIKKTKKGIKKDRQRIEEARNAIIGETIDVFTVLGSLLTKLSTAIEEMRQGQKHLSNSINYLWDETFETLPFLHGTMPDSLPKIKCTDDIDSLTKAQVQLYLRGYGKPDNDEEGSMKKELAILHGVPPDHAYF